MSTVFSNNTLAKILSNYNIGNLKEFNTFTDGSVQTNILLNTDKGNYVLRYYRQGRSLQSVSFEVNLINYLKRKNYPCPGLFKNINGNFVSLHNEKPFVIFEFIEGIHIDNPTEKQQKELTKKIAELQNATKTYKPSYRKFRLNYNIKSCKELAIEKAEKIGSINANIKLKWFIKELSTLQLPKSLPKGICHCDFHFSNILFKNNKFKALIDFDDANYTFLMFDLVYLADPFKKEFDWNTWKKFNPKDNVFDFNTTRFFVSEYNKVRPLNDLEKKYSFDLFKLSVLIDCIWYFERGNSEDFFEKRKIDHLNSLGRETFYRSIFL